jgi:hypothetical protein
VKRKGFCVAPFRNAEFFHDGKVWQCVSGGWSEEEKRWVNAWITCGPSGNSLEDNWEDIWNGEVSQKLRQSMHDGDFKYCDSTECGFLNRWYNDDVDETIYDNGYFPIYDESTYHKLWNAKEINPNGEEKWKQIISEKMVKLPWGPECVIFSHDRSCNLKCPSCRLDYIQTEGEERKKSEKIQEIILCDAMDNVNELYITASGDGFGGEFWRNLLKSITMEKYPDTRNLHLHTNGNGWTRKMWNSLSNLHDIPRITAEISIDACTEETYNKIRVGGNWKTLQKNLHFIFTDIPNLDFVRMTFVVQDNNYKEMIGFIMMSDYFQKLNNMRTEVNFIHINNWGTFTNEVWEIKNINNKDHPEHKDFIDELENVKSLRKKYKNLQIYTNIEE